VANAGPRSSEPTLSPFLEATTWASELEQWAFVKERVLSRLDIRAARKARGLAADLRDAVVEIETHQASSDQAATAIALGRLARLRNEAVLLVESETTATPTSRASGSRQRVELLAPVTPNALGRVGS